MFPALSRCPYHQGLGELLAEEGSGAWAGLLGFDRSAQLVDPVETSGCALMKSALACSRTFELATRAASRGPLVFERPSVRFGCLQRGGAGVEVMIAAVPGEEPAAGILGTCKRSLTYGPSLRLRRPWAANTRPCDRCSPSPRTLTVSLARRAAGFAYLASAWSTAQR